MNEILENELKSVVVSMVSGAVKSLARHNKRAAEILTKAKEWTDKLEEHNSFLDDIIAIIKPALHLAHSILEKVLPSYMHIIDWVIDICTKVYEQAIA